jgi:hypothetical protein
VALSGIGLIFGEVFAMGILFNLTKHMNYYDAFKFTAGLIVFFSFVLLIMVKDPDFDELRNKSKHHKLAVER